MKEFSAENNSDDNSRISHLSVIARKSLWTSGGGIMSQVFTPVISVVSTRLLGVELYGVFNLLTSWGNLLADFARLGSSDTLLRFIPKYNATDKNHMISRAVSFTLISSVSISLLFTIAVFISSSFVSELLFRTGEYSSFIMMYSPTIVFTTMYIVFISVLHAYKEQKYVVFARDILANVSKLLTLILFAFLGLRLSAALFSNLARDLTILFLCLYFINKYHGNALKNIKEKYEDTKEFTKYSLTLFGSNLFNKYTMRLDIILLGFFRIAYDVGLYSVALKIQPFIYMFSSSMALIFSPIVVELFEKKDINNLGFIYKRVTKWTALVSTPIVLVIVIFSENILRIFGNDFLPASGALIILSAGSLFADMFGLSGQVINMIGKPMVNLINSIVLTVIMILSFVILIPAYGIAGAAISYSIGLFVINVLRIIQVYKFINIHPFSMSLLKVAASALLTFFSVYYLKMFLDGVISNQFFWIAEVIFCLALYFAATLVFRYDKYDKEILIQLKRSLLSKFKLG